MAPTPRAAGRRLALLAISLIMGSSVAGEAALVARTDTIAKLRAASDPVGTGSIVDANLTDSELAATQVATFALPLRNYVEMKARINRGEVISVTELTDRYLPKRETWLKVANWAKSRGLVVEDDPANLTVLAHGSVAEVQRALGMKFARVMGADFTDHTSAVTAPVLDSEINADVVAILNLQPHIEYLAQVTISKTSENAILPSTLAEFYNASDLGLDGSGQTIVIQGSTKVDPNDLIAFWDKAGLPNLINNYSTVLPPFIFDENYTGSIEESLDIEWASAMAPGAKIIQYRAIGPVEVSSWVVSEFRSGRPIGQLSDSHAGYESVYTLPASQREARSQCYAVMAALGVSIFVPAGDWGSTQKVVNGVGILAYDPTGITSAGYPSSDPFVTGVGGTTIIFAKNQGLPALPMDEGAWSIKNVPIPGQIKDGASGGGISVYFARPSWQTGAGLPAGTMRCAPDVAGPSATNFGFYVRWLGNDLQGGGTSLASPVWAGFCALINQARAEKGLPLLGLLGPRIYPLNGTSCFNQMTKGSNGGTDPFSDKATNGAYSVGPNYTMITGLGSPNVGKLVTALTAEDPVPSAPVTPSTPSTPTTPTTPSTTPSTGGGGGGGAPSWWLLLALGLLVVARQASLREEARQD